MPRYLVKIAPDTDLYVLWSTITESPHHIGTRRELEELGSTRCSGVEPREVDPERFDRADTTGTSSLPWRSGATTHPGFYAFGSGRFMVGQQGTIAREDIPELCRLIDTDPYDDTVYVHLLEPFDD